MIEPISKIVAYAEKLKIVFDINKATTGDVDLSSDDDEEAVTYFEDGRIVIGARGLNDAKKKFVVMGNVIHELCHYAMLLIYKNECNPYQKNDKTTESEFRKIFITCKKALDRTFRNTETYETILNIFDRYELAERVSELIVRVPELVAFYANHKKKLKKVQSLYRNLFRFYYDKTFVDLKLSS